MRIAVTGAAGQVGLELSHLLPDLGHEVIPLTRQDLDISDLGSVESTLERLRPDLVINTAAYTDVDGCESERDLSYAVNAKGPANLAQTAERLGAAVVHLSTNYVFDGRSERPYEPFDPPNPLSAYGRDKLAGERLVMALSSRFYVVRSSGVFGEGHNFVRTMLRVGPERGSLKVKSDEFISPTYAPDLARGLVEIVSSRTCGLYHLTNSGSCSWYEFARRIFDRANLPDVEVLPVPASEYPLPAARPPNGLLSDLGSPKLRPWTDALDAYLAREGLR
ncbi:rmlD: dTDP-4-dehydrorhamnose reductase [Rubrobacter radiotolerans]|uniref:dTDP-4-dehydrorhamnose reductase n=1 Tax=Rubrobacter radiotolerans TaxID=42256 RepID=A0A023WZM0_RUBRA|nr:dTDP-4-dehydrorhamnose reductase [Rubrobacter radiotolerans]AHY45518.1 rmlD: dTDP-4-dehydrorhamnose reductase [Rubrobacter radiotolerans]MDX5892931.1 dTDP-4-dehydrorhamnose reductase [Rubrobacter radiotolerans]SMC02768.1 dTDP-4-dehydrorhamnose reductase [Rubrobacter radiotolerans DSM 5868]